MSRDGLPPPPATAAQRRAQREQRKEDLLIASALLRQHAAGDLLRLADQADRLGRRWHLARDWFASPAGRAGGAAALVTLALAGRRLRWGRLLRWGWLGWRAWRAWRGSTR